ncbi:hypothetical protein NDU88_002066 [Pleurodeles waltl]|uniref:Uncharacterized protein n=1 Tax=Pleurodeles waltl TaxID=8319 RepID=A0AAV7U876_PLEWA|nr:hypothetical protein NDU88_002066 [Pleurodeles waltl]
MLLAIRAAGATGADDMVDKSEGGAWPRWRRERTRCRELHRLGLTKSIVTPAYCLLDARLAEGRAETAGARERRPGARLWARGAGGVGPRLGRCTLPCAARRAGPRGEAWKAGDPGTDRWGHWQHRKRPGGPGKREERTQGWRAGRPWWTPPLGPR